MPKYKKGQLFRTADVKTVFSRGEITKWSYDCYTTAKIIQKTIAVYRFNHLPENAKINYQVTQD